MTDRLEQIMDMSEEEILKALDPNRFTFKKGVFCDYLSGPTIPNMTKDEKTLFAGLIMSGWSQNGVGSKQWLRNKHSQGEGG